MDASKKTIITRVAPSPTGLFHIGTARTSLYNYLYAKKHNGTFILRIEDTDKGRCEKRFEDDILEGLKWLGLEWDEFVRQSERTALYTEKLQALVDMGKAYISREAKKDDPTVEVEVVRLKNPGKEVSFEDAVRGTITFDTTELGDFVIARSIVDPLYHFAVVVDDSLGGVTDVIRGEDHISNTPRQILIMEALGFSQPRYVHLPLILARDRSKLSKRKGAVSVTEYRNAGYSPDTVVNYLALLGWNSGTEKEIFSLEELVEVFSIEQIQKGGAVFDIEKMKWMQREHNKRTPKEQLVEKLLDTIGGERVNTREALLRSSRALDDMVERYALTSELREALEAGEYDFYEEAPSVTKEGLAWKKDKSPERLTHRLETLGELLSGISTSAFTYESVRGAVLEFAETEGKGGVLWPLRYALSGKEFSPDPFILAEALGKEETLKRITGAHNVTL